MRSTKGYRARSWPPDFAAILQEIHRREMKSWLQPKSGDLALDVAYLQGRASNETKAKIKGVYARATIVMAAATIEAVTNDAIANIYGLMTDTIPFECIGEAPWCHFSGRSTKRMKSLLERGSFVKKRDYLMEVTGYPLEYELVEDIDRVMLFRNRIVHMSFHERPGKYRGMLHTKEVSPLAKQACDTTRHYLEFLRFVFGELNLPVPTIRPEWHFDDDLKKE